MTGLLLCVGTPLASLADIAKQGAAALELAGDYTDYIEAARRRKPTTPAAEVQQQLLPPRIARIAGAQLAGTLLPTYEVGGDWFDFVENRDGAWLAIADAPGNGPTAAGLGAAALGALRAARRSGQDLEDALASVHETVRQLGNARIPHHCDDRAVASRDSDAHLGQLRPPPRLLGRHRGQPAPARRPRASTARRPRTQSPATRRPACSCTPENA